MAVVGTFTQQPNDVLDYDVNFTDFLSEGDLIVDAAVTVAPLGLTVAVPVVIDSGRRVKLWVQGGSSGVTYKIDLRVTTDLGRVKEDEVRMRIKEY